MNGKSDALTGILLAFVGIAVLLAWRSGMLKRALGLSTPASSRSAPSITQMITRIGASDSATALPTASLVPLTVSPQGPGSVVAQAGTVDNGYSSTVYAAPHPYSDARNFVAFETYRDESYRAAQRAPWWGNPNAGAIIDRLTGATGGGGGGGGGGDVLLSAF